MYLGNMELTAYIGDKELSGVYIGANELWTNEFVVYDATYTFDGYGITIQSENIKNANYVKTATGHYVTTERGTEPPYTSSSAKTILELTEACKKYKYAKVTIASTAYANYGDVTVYFNGGVVCEDDNKTETTVFIDLSKTLIGTGTIIAENRSSEPTWGASGRITITNVTLTNSMK